VLTSFMAASALGAPDWESGTLSGSARQRRRWAVGGGGGGGGGSERQRIGHGLWCWGELAKGRRGRAARGRGEANGFLRLKARDFRVDWA